MALVGLNIISIFKCKHHYRSGVLRKVPDRMLDSKFSLPLGEFLCFVYMLCILHVVSSKLTRTLRAMGAGVSSQTAPVQITLVTWCALINN